MSVPVKVIPLPQSVKRGEGTLTVTKGDSIHFCEEAAAGGGLLLSLTGLPRSEGGKIRLIFDGKVAGDEAYRLSITGEGVVIAASAEAGFYYGAQTLRQLFPPSLESEGIAEETALPLVEIGDAPRFPYRGFMLDCSRHFFGTETVKSLLDLMALHKLNRFHWHLTDDQGWRIEIERYPLLTEIASRRKETQTGGRPIFKNSRIYDGLPHGGFYTKAQIREIVAYARERQIEVIPEIDMPGHLVSLLSAYPEYSCTGGPFEVRTQFGISEDVLCLGKPGVLDFVKNILDEVAELFPFAHIHIGGDETPTTRWESCPDCARLMEEKGIKEVRGLQTYFTDEISAHLKSRGCRIICWDEVLKGTPSEEVIVQFWAPDGGKRVAESIRTGGREFIISPFMTYYLDYTYRMISLRRTYETDPVFPEWGEGIADRILGVESPLWTEMVEDEKRIHWQTFPRLTATAETAWTGQERKSYADFLDRLEQLERRFALLGVRGATRQAYTRASLRSPFKFPLALLFSKTHPATREYRRFGRS